MRCERDPRRGHARVTSASSVPALALPPSRNRPPLGGQKMGIQRSRVAKTGSYPLEGSLVDEAAGVPAAALVHGGFGGRRRGDREAEPSRSQVTASCALEQPASARQVTEGSPPSPGGRTCNIAATGSAAAAGWPLSDGFATASASTMIVAEVFRLLSRPRSAGGRGRARGWLRAPRPDRRRRRAAR